jgi:hypothetical protein
VISGAGRVESIFGDWPEFSDGPILEVCWPSADQRSLTIDYIDAQRCKLLEISGDDTVTVYLEACYGPCGSFNGAHVEVIEAMQDSVLRRLPFQHGLNPTITTR